MTGSVSRTNPVQGLSHREVVVLQQQYGKNVFRSTRQLRFLYIVWDVVREPMFILLLIACSLYFILGNTNEGIMMAVAMTIVTAISLYQEVKSSRALDALKQYTEPRITVIRDGKEQVISNEDLVPGDIILLEEGMKIPADAEVIEANDLSVDESIVTGESFPVEKNSSREKSMLYQGTTINTGKCTAIVTSTGNNTTLGKIGKAIESYNSQKTLLQVQTNRFVRRLALFGLLGFIVIFVVNYLHYDNFATSLLFALTLAMSAVPEEIPVAFSSFMALGAYKMSKLGIISRRPQVIENLGAVNVICLDKTGTITENKMQVKTVYNYKDDSMLEIETETRLPEESTLFYALLASESNPFDSMEKAIWEAYQLHTKGRRRENMKMIHEYPLDGQPPMMTHVYRENNDIIVAAKGAAERIFRVCKLDESTRKKISQYVQDLAENGYRVLGVASAGFHSPQWPGSQDDFDWQFEGLIALYDPPRENIPDVIKSIYDARIDIKLLTGDYPGTAINIARKAGIQNSSEYYIGEQVMEMPEEELRAAVKKTNIFARMFPDAKLKVINAIRANGEIVAMTGDGVNDAPSLKASDIGIAMGKKGTETARQASELVLTDDNLEKIITAVSQGRKIYSNLLKAIRYIIGIHIPIILTASLPLILGWRYPNIFTPIHVIFLELLMGPTCSIFFEREPVEKNLMQSAPRSNKAGLFTSRELLTSIVQGLGITAGVLVLYYIYMENGYSIEVTRTMVFTTLIFSNVFLTFVDRSFTRTIYHTSRYKNKLAPVIIVVSVILLCLLHFVVPVRNLFNLAPIRISDILLSLAVALVSVLWFEVYKISRSRQSETET